MQHFLRDEVLDGENVYECDNCNEVTRVDKKCSIRTNILVVHLKRFDSYGKKLTDYVAYLAQSELVIHEQVALTENESPQFQTNNVKKSFRTNSIVVPGILAIRLRLQL